jgi:hypothetical protein
MTADEWLVRELGVLVPVGWRMDGGDRVGE